MEIRTMNVKKYGTQIIAVSAGCVFSPTTEALTRLLLLKMNTVKDADSILAGYLFFTYLRQGSWHESGRRKYTFHFLRLIKLSPGCGSFLYSEFIGFGNPCLPFQNAFISKKLSFTFSPPVLPVFFQAALPAAAVV
jgi:hypothetical protein